jgi:hypothetical protein
LLYPQTLLHNLQADNKRIGTESVPSVSSESIAVEAPTVKTASAARATPHLRQVQGMSDRQTREKYGYEVEQLYFCIAELAWDICYFGYVDD